MKKWTRQWFWWSVNYHDSTSMHCCGINIRHIPVNTKTNKHNNINSVNKHLSKFSRPIHRRPLCSMQYLKRKPAKYIYKVAQIKASTCHTNIIRDLHDNKNLTFVSLRFIYTNNNKTFTYLHL